MTLRLRAWTYRRLRLGRHAAATAEEALTSVVAVYSAHPTAPLALAARTRGMRGDDFRDLERRRRALRIPGMRGSLFLAPVGSAARVFVPGRLNTAKLVARLGRGDLSEQEYRATADRVVASASTPMLPNHLEAVAGVRGIGMSLLLRTMRGEGRILAIADPPLRAARLRYVDTQSWAPGCLDGGDDDSALSALARDYLAAYGPARVSDLAWWAGIAKGVAARAVATQATVDVGGGLLLLSVDEPAFDAIQAPSDSIDLLPKWDPYTMGHAPDGRARLVHADNQPRIYVCKGVVAPGQPNVGLPGDGYPVVLVDGEAVGTWNLALKGTTVHLFDTVGPATQRRLAERLEAVDVLMSA
jgi:hypothetical protein